MLKPWGQWLEHVRKKYETKGRCADLILAIDRQKGMNLVCSRFGGSSKPRKRSKS